MISENWNNLIKPSTVEVNTVDSNKNKAKIVVGPLERGYGITLGNSLRRVLLSSLQGTSVTGMFVSGVKHEFDNIEGVIDDVIDVVLNVKDLVVSSSSPGRRKIHLNVTGPCEVNAGMIECCPGVEVINKDLVLFTITEKKEVNIEFTVETGKGYSPASENRSPDAPIGYIAIDSIFSPIKNVSYKVESSRVGNVIDYDKLILDVETDGSIAPEMSVALSAKILQDQFSTFINFDDNEVHVEEEEVLEFDKNLLKKVDELELSVRSQNCLKNDNIVYIGDLVKKSEGEMLRTPNFGRKSLNEIKEVISNLGLRFGMTVDAWPPENIEELVKKFEDPY